MIDWDVIYKIVMVGLNCGRIWKARPGPPQPATSPGAKAEKPDKKPKAKRVKKRP
jgi:hypothetical protein